VISSDPKHRSPEELLADIKVLQQENQMLLEKTQEFLVLQVAGRLLDENLPENELYPGILERMAVFMDIPLCATGILVDTQFLPDYLYSMHCDTDDVQCHLSLPEAIVESLQAHVITAPLALKVTLEMPERNHIFTNVLVLPTNKERVFLFADDLPESDRLAEQLSVLTEVIDKINRHVYNQDLKLELEGANRELGSTVRSQSLKYQESEEQFKMVMDQSPNVVEIYDLKGTQVQVNEAYEGLWGIPAETTLGKFNLFKSRDAKRLGLLEYINRAYAGEALVIPEYEVDITGAVDPSKVGPSRWLSTRVYPLKDVAGKVRNVVLTHEDVTDKKLAEFQLKESEARYKGLFTSSVDGIFILDKEGYYLDVNPAAEEILGYTHDELVLLNVKDIVFPEDLHKSKKFLHLLETEGFYRGYEGRVVTKGGDVRSVEVSSIAIYQDGEMIGSHDILRDVTDRKRQESERLAFQFQVNNSQKLESLGTMIGGISHELNNVLQSMFLYGGLIQDQLPENQELRENLEHLLEDGDRARDIVRQILTFSREGTPEYSIQTIQNLVHESLSFIRATLPPEIEIKYNLHENCPPVSCDPTQIHQVVINLCNNAKDAMSQGGLLEVDLHPVNFENGADPKELVLTVRDSGGGMETEVLERVFDPFFTTKEIGKGTGLGLSVVHGIIEMMGGQISVTSERGQGTIFTVILPVAEHAEIAQATETVSILEGQPLSILLVDDEKSIRVALSATLARKGFKVQDAASGGDAFEMFSNPDNSFDLIITDLSMPGMSGMELVQRVRNVDSDIWVLLSSGNMEIENMTEYLEQGVDGLIQKPWSANQLMAKITELSKRRDWKTG